MRTGGSGRAKQQQLCGSRPLHTGLISEAQQDCMRQLPPANLDIPPNWRTWVRRLLLRHIHPHHFRDKLVNGHVGVPLFLEPPQPLKQVAPTDGQTGWVGGWVKHQAGGGPAAAARSLRRGLKTSAQPASCVQARGSYRGW